MWQPNPHNQKNVMFIFMLFCEIVSNPPFKPNISFVNYDGNFHKPS